jgi:type I restriction enzyme, S subunit
MDSKYLMYQMFSKKNYLNDIANAPVVPIINKTTFENIEISKHPLEQQKQIAKTLDKANELIELRKESITKLDALAKSIFIDMFGDPVSNPKKWEVKEIRDIVKDVKYGTSEKSSEEVKEYAVLRMNNLTYSGHLDLTSLKYMDLEEKDKEKYLVQKGDLLFNRTNSKELVGKTVVYNLDSPMAYAGYLIRVRTINTSTNVYISAFLNSKVGKTVLFNMCKSIVGMANINAQELQNIKLPVPPLDLQNKFAKIIEKIEEQKSLYTQELKKLQENFDALLQKSFQE